MAYKNFNANPKGRKTGDCYIRALSKAAKMCWKVVLEKLVSISMDKYLDPSDTKVIDQFVKDVGGEAKKIDYLIGPGTKRRRPVVWEFARDNPTGRYVLRVANHLVAVANGNYYDTWDSGGKSVYKYWKIK